MKITGIVLLCCAILVSGQNDANDPPTTAEPVTVAPNTTEPTTTKPPNTTTVPTTTTTTEPPTTTTAKPAPAPPTPPKPDPPVPDYPRNVGKWSVEDSNNSSCIALKAALQIVVTKDNQTFTLNIPPYAVANGSCNKPGPEQITITWNSTVLTDDKTEFEKNKLTLTFMVNRTKDLQAGESGSGISPGKYGVHNVNAVLYLDQGNSSNTTVNPMVEDLSDIAIFQTPLNHSYACLTEEVVKSNDGMFSLKIRDIQMEAYRSDTPGHREFSSSVQCPADDATDVVPIAVGAALAGLVVIVLIAYLIGRRRSRARGYQSV